MPGCPFGFHAPDEEDVPAEGSIKKESRCPFTGKVAQDDDGKDSKKKTGGGCPFSGKPALNEDGKEDDRFDYNKDPISWFYQNQIKSEEEFQAKKAALREEAKRRLEDIMERKNKKVVWDPEDENDDWSISSSELSAWDSDVESVCSMVSCANDWLETYQFPSHAMTALKYTCGAALVVIINCMRVAWLSYSSVSQFWGVVDYKWASVGSIAVSFLALVCATLGMQAWMCKSKRYLLYMQLTTHVLFTSALALAVYAYTFPSQVNAQIKQSACMQYKGSSHVSRLCELIPSIDAQLGSSCRQVLQSAALVTVLSLALMMVGTWYQWELAHVEKKAIKHKRRYKRRKQTIPWHKLKIEGPISYCGGKPGPAQPAGTATGAETQQEGPSVKDKDV